MSTEPVGSLAQEAAKLIAVMQGWADLRDPSDPADAGRRGHQPEPGGNEPGHPIPDEDHPHNPTPYEETDAYDNTDGNRRDHHARHQEAPECHWCPVCQLARMAKATTPEVREHLTSAAMSLALAFKGLMDGVDQSPSRTDPVEKIDLDLDSPED